MKETELERLREQLLQLQAELRLLQEGASDSTKPVQLDQASVGRLSRMDAMQAQEMAQDTARRREQQLQRIERALARIEEGDYGECYVCGEEIAPARLGIDPAATRCIRCVEG